MEIPNNIISWLNHTLRSEQEQYLINLETGFEGAIVALNKQSMLLVDELQKELLFNEIHLLIKQSREFIETSNSKKIDEKLKLLDAFEIALRKHLSFDQSSFKPLLKWNGTNKVLYEILVHLKTKTNDKGQSLLDSSFEDIAVFLKSSFNLFHKTELSTINGELRKFSKIVANSTGKVRLDIDK